METNYELKHKCLLVPLKAVLLVLAMFLVGFTTYAQQGKSVKVATNQQLIEAMENPSIGTVELSAGFYEYLNYQADEAATIVKKPNEGGSRDLQCTYFIIGSNVCFEEPNEFGFVSNIAQAGTLDPLSCGCCPPVDMGTWSVTGKPAGSTVNFIFPINKEVMPFEVNMPGFYILRYTWGPPWNSLVETEYYFYGLVTVDLSAPDVCEENGLSTLVSFTNSSPVPDPNSPVTWTLNGLPYTGPSATGQFTLTVPECGLYELCVTVNPSKCPPVTECIIIEFSCQPLADAGPDINVCNDLCYFELVGSTGLTEYSPTFAYSWVQLSGPGTLDFLNNDGFLVTETPVCREPFPPTCSYGEYEVEFQVQNGQCYDEDQAFVRFYQMPTATAGDDQHICNTFSFSLEAVPFDYCGTEGVNYWSHSWWELVSQPDACTVTFDELDPETGVTITGCAPEPACKYGKYVFVWHELNVKIDPVTGDTLWGEEHCYASDPVVVTIYEDPIDVDAGPDMVFCDTWAFSLVGIGDTPCYTMTEIVYHWEKTAEPGSCTVELFGAGTLNPDVEISGCDPAKCKYGEYIFTLTQSNGYMNGNTFVEVCSSSDDVSYWIFQPVEADAGRDTNLCNEFAFSLHAIPTEFCGDPIDPVTGEGNYNTWGEWTFVSGPTSAVSIVNTGDAEPVVTIDPLSVPCPYGKYIFKWTEYNGFDVPGAVFKGCWGEDFVSVFIHQTPDVGAGLDMEFCEQFEFYLDGTVDEPCNQGMAYSISWEWVEQPGTCDISIGTGPDPLVSITNCAPCQYGEYVFRITQSNGYYDDLGLFHMVCEDSEDVSVWIWQQPAGISAGVDQNLCNDFTFDLTGVGSDYCGDFGVNYNNWYSWTLVSAPADCDVTITNGDQELASVVVDNCTDLPDICAFGEYVFKFTEKNGSDIEACEASDLVSVFIYEEAVADAGDDVNECLYWDNEFPYCTDMTGSMEFCYSMYGVWTKTCGPGGVVFDNLNNPEAEVCFPVPGRYKFTWTVRNGGEGCMDADEVIFDLLEQPTALGRESELEAPCDLTCIDLGLAGIDKYDYTGENLYPDCPNFIDMAHWSLEMGPAGTDPLQADFADDTDPATQLCVSYYGGYTVRWNEVNVAADGLSQCESFFDVFVEFYETPTPTAIGGDTCGNCFTLQGELYDYLPAPNQHLNDAFWWEVLPGGNCPISIDINALNPEVCIEDVANCYGTYGFVLHESNGECVGTDTAWVTFRQIPPPVAVCFQNNPNQCGEMGGGNNGGIGLDFNYSGCLQPNDVLEVCAEGCTDIYLGPWCNCLPGLDWDDPVFWGWTFEWSLISPAGTVTNSQAGYFDFENGAWVYPWIDICWGECCDTARLYLTITNDEGCENTMEYKFFVHHKPCIDIVGPDEAEVGMTSQYCNDCPDDPCYLYNWTAEHCGHITDGQGTQCIDVLWDSYNVNGGWGQITLTVFDTCTGCCNYDEMPVKIYPPGTLGGCTLKGQVLYQNNGLTPLNGVVVTLKNNGIPVMETESFVKFFDGPPPYTIVGYYEFPGVSCDSTFEISASYDAPWYGANATDALAVELRTIGVGALPGGAGWFVNQPLQEEAMNVNDNAVINATDALWIKQRAINMVNYFPAGNWAFEPGISWNSLDGTPYNIYALNMGDANRSNVPNSNKSMPDISLVNDGTINVVTGQEFELPIRIAKANQFGAITLSLEYNSDLIEVVGVVPEDGMISNISNGVVSIAWSNVNTKVLAENEVVMTLKVKATGEIASAESLFRIGMNTEFADASASVIEPVTLKTFGITTAPAALDYFLSSNRPNPFSTSTFIEYTMPETGKVKLSVLDMLGQEIAILVEATQNAGSYTVEFSAAGLATGVYIYKITVDGETRDFISTQRMVISH